MEEILKFFRELFKGEPDVIYSNAYQTIEHIIDVIESGKLKRKFSNLNYLGVKNITSHGGYDLGYKVSLKTTRGINNIQTHTNIQNNIETKTLVLRKGKQDEDDYCTTTKVTIILRADNGTIDVHPNLDGTEEFKEESIYNILQELCAIIDTSLQEKVKQDREEKRKEEVHKQNVNKFIDRFNK